MPYPKPRHALFLLWEDLLGGHSSELKIFLKPKTLRFAVAMEALPLKHQSLTMSVSPANGSAGYCLCGRLVVGCSFRRAVRSREGCNSNLSARVVPRSSNIWMQSAGGSRTTADLISFNAGISQYLCRALQNFCMLTSVERKPSRRPCTGISHASKSKGMQISLTPGPLVFQTVLNRAQNSNPASR